MICSTVPQPWEGRCWKIPTESRSPWVRLRSLDSCSPVAIAMVSARAGQALQRALPARALTIAIATGLQESKLRNLTQGDRDSVGIFQQRPSQGWGTVEQIMDPLFATTAFYDALVKVDGYQDLPITEAAQAVQRSGFPEAYGEHEAAARAWASAMYGYSAGTAVSYTHL